MISSNFCLSNIELSSARDDLTENVDLVFMEDAAYELVGGGNLVNNL